MPRQRIDHSRTTYGFPDDFPQRLVRFKEESGLGRPADVVWPEKSASRSGPGILLRQAKNSGPPGSSTNRR